MEMVVEGFGMCDKDLVSFNRSRKHQQANFLSNITTGKGDNIEKLLISDWQETYERLLVKNRPMATFGAEHPTKENWTLRRRELNKIHTLTFTSLSPLDR